MILDTLDQFEAIFDTEERSFNYLVEIWSSLKLGCPNCRSEKYYTNRDGSKTCANTKNCKYRFSIKVKSLMEHTKLPCRDWLILIYRHIRSNGRFSSLNHSRKLTYATAFIIDCKIKHAVKDIVKVDKPIFEIFKESCRNLWLKYGEIDFRKGKIYNGRNVLDPTGIIDFDDKEDYSKCYYTAKKLLFHQLSNRWIFYDFCSPEELLSEVVISLADSGVSDINGSLMVEMLKKTITKLWRNHVNGNPKLKEWYNKYRREWKREGRAKLASWYVKEIIAIKHKKEGDWVNYQTLNDITSEIKSKKLSLSDKRSHRNYLDKSEFNY
jgi:hypothetical protein